VRSVRLLGAQTIITGISAHVASDLIKLGVRLEDITTRRRLADGLRLALEFLNVRVERGQRSEVGGQ
jgi:anti-anti-sigma regulatory factor